ncbi:WD40-repeat-containing domain protein, partial [Dissophora ornata]
ERQRLENIRRNQKAMEMFNLPQAVSAVAASSRSHADRNKRSAPTHGVKREKKAKVTENLPRRSSNRLAKIEPDGPAAAKKLEEYKESASSMHYLKSARRAGILSLSDVSTGHGDGAKFAKLMEEMATYVPEKARVKDLEDESDGEDGPAPSLRRKVQALKIKGPWPTLKVCQGRIYCMAIHANKDKVLVCGGDVDGNLGFWDLDESLAEDHEPDYDEEPNIYSYKAHTRTLSSMQYSPTDTTKLFTTSYDGSVRYLDLVKQKFMESYVVSNDVSDHLGSVSIDSTGNQLWFADNDGAVTLKDVRTPKDEMVYRKVLHEKKVGCVNVNPKYSHLIATSSLDRTMKIWDIRTFGKYKEDEPIPELAEFPHRLSVTSAMWSPDGMSIASTSYDDNVRVFNNFNPALPDIKEIPEPVRIHHNNQSGRWVTMLRAVWSHQFNWFCIGNMNKSVDIYSRGTGDLMANLRDAQVLTTVPAVNTWHPNRVLLASGMANGKMVVWR